MQGDYADKVKLSSNKGNRACTQGTLNIAKIISATSAETMKQLTWLIAKVQQYLRSFRINKLVNKREYCFEVNLAYVCLLVG